MKMRFILFVIGTFFVSAQLSFGQASLGETKTYTFKKVGWTMEAPVSWKILSNDEVDKLDQRGMDSIKSVGKDDVADKMMDTNDINLITIKKDETNYFMSSMQYFDQSLDFYKSMEISDSVVYATFIGMKLKCDSSSGTEIIDGLKFSVLYLKIDVGHGITLHNNLYTRLINGYCFSMVVAYINEESKATLRGILKSSKFSIRD